MNLNPYAAPQSVPEKPQLKLPARTLGRLHYLVAVQAIVIVCALAAELYDIESIMASGPIFALIGGVIAVVAVRQHDPLGVCFGLSAVVFAGWIVFLINYNHWSPRAADRPVKILSLCYALVAFPVAGYLFARRSEPRE